MRWFCHYLIQGFCSRKIMGWKIYDADDADYVVSVLKRVALAEDIHAMTDKCVLLGAVPFRSEFPAPGLVILGGAWRWKWTSFSGATSNAATTASVTSHSAQVRACSQ